MINFRSQNRKYFPPNAKFPGNEIPKCNACQIDVQLVPQFVRADQTRYEQNKSYTQPDSRNLSMIHFTEIGAYTVGLITNLVPQVRIPLQRALSIITTTRV